MKNKMYTLLCFAFFIAYQNVLAQKPTVPVKPPVTPTKPTPSFPPPPNPQPYKPSTPVFQQPPVENPKKNKVSLLDVLNAIGDLQTPKPEVVTVEPLKCGRLNKPFLTSTPTENIKGGISLLVADTVFISKLKTNIIIDLSYSNPCAIYGMLKYPNGQMVSFSNYFELKILTPGHYELTFSVNCDDKKCESGKKIIACYDPIICNCGPKEIDDNLEITTNEFGPKVLVKNGQPITIDRSKPTNFTKAINCIGNVCEGYNTYTIKNTNNEIIDTGLLVPNQKIKNLKIGSYTLTVYAYCARKLCTVYTYPINFINQTINEYYVEKVRFRWGNQIGINRGFVSMPQTIKPQPYNGVLFGLIADMPFGTGHRLHLWPAINVFSTTYKSMIRYKENNNSYTPVYLNYCNKMAEASLDLSIAYPLKKDIFLHFFTGLSVEAYIHTKASYSSTSSSAINHFMATRNSPAIIANPSKFKIGLLLDVNRNWVWGLHYYKTSTQFTNQILYNTIDKGIALKLAYFYNR